MDMHPYSYAVEIFIDSDTGIEQRLLVGAVQLAGEWEREFDAVGNPVESPISSTPISLPLMLFTSILISKILQPIGLLSKITTMDMILNSYPQESIMLKPLLVLSQIHL